MTNKEYKTRLGNHEYYNGYDCLTNNERTELSHNITKRKQDGEIILDGFNRRASIKKVNGGYILTSYYTNVCSFINGEFNKLWCGYSNTTLKHINLFRKFVGLDTLNKREWVAL